MYQKRLVLLVALLALTFSSACRGDDDPTDADVGIGDDVDNGDSDVDDQDLPEHRSTDCDALMEGYCSMPWPSNLYLQRDESRTTGYTLDFGDTSLPSSRLGGHVDPAAWRRLDGYGWGTPVIVLFPGVDISNMPHEDGIEVSMENDGLDAFYFKVTDDGLEPVPFWAELDLWTDNVEEQVLYLRPAVILEDDTRYVVGFRNLTTEDGSPIARSEAFEKYLSGEAADDAELAWRQERFDEVFRLLDDAGIDRGELTLAWDFHTGSSDGLHSTLLQLVEDGLKAADDEAIVLTMNITERTRSEDPNIALDIRGTFRVPHFLEPSTRSGAEPAYLFHRDQDGTPIVYEWVERPFWMIIPHDALDGVPHGLVKYGHGMLGSGDQVRGGFNKRIAAEHNLIFFAADFSGFSFADIPVATQALANPTYFVELVDRMHQGVLEWVLLTRAMREQIETHSALEDHNLVIDHDRIFYSGISQGGIYGVTYLAVEPTIERGHFGVPGHNYAMLMERSSNYAPYFQILRSGFSARLDQSMAIPIIQLLWDQIDPISYLPMLNHRPFNPEMPKHGIFATAKGDYQVAVVTKEITARSNIGIPLMENYDREREPFGVQWATYPHTGSAVVNWDFGNPWPPIGNLPPADGLDDPHGFGRQRDDHNLQMVHFFDTAEIIDVCNGEPCYFNMFQ